MKKYVIEGTYWSAGDSIYIDTQDDNCDYTVVCLNELIKEHIRQNTKVTIVINVDENREEFE